MNSKHIFIFFLLIMTGKASAQCTETPENKVLLVGDSWAFFMSVDQTLNNVFNKWGHSGYRYFTNLTLAENGAETDDFLTAEKQQEIVNQLNANPSIEFVHLSIGGNDVLGDWNVNFTQEQTDSLEQKVSERLLAVIDFIKSAKPGIRILWSGYVYPNFEEVVESFAPFQTNHPFYGTWEGMGFPDFLQLNNLLNEFSAEVEAYTLTDPQVDFINCTGLMQYTFGQNAPLGVSPGGTYPAMTAPLPAGFPEYPSPRNSMRDYGITKDCFHLSAPGFNDLIDYHTRKFYHKLLMDDFYALAPAGNTCGSVSQNGNTSAQLKLGKENGTDYSAALSFNLSGMTDTSIAKASVFLRRESLSGTNPVGSSTLQLKIKSGFFGTSADIEATDVSAVSDAQGAPCLFGSNSGTGHWLRLDLPVSFLPYLQSGENVQFLLSSSAATEGTMVFSNGTDPELAPVLNIRYGSALSPVQEFASEKADVRIFPNPTDDGILNLVQNPAGSFDRAEVYDIAGKSVTNLTITGSSLDISSLPAGMYVLRLAGKAGQISRRIIKN